jgi:hypothetical protein
MADKHIDFYAYLWLREDGTPYYAGKGSGYRAFKNTPDRCVYRPVNSARILVFYRSSEQEAFDTEKELIRNWGRLDLGTGCLRNRTDGGEGGSGYRHTEDFKMRYAEIVRADKQRHKKISQALKGISQTEARRAKTSEAIKQWWNKRKAVSYGE